MKWIFLIGALLAVLPTVRGQQFVVAASGVFKPQHKKVLLVKDASLNKSLIIFKTNLHVNTDGTPMSYHPYDLQGTTKALNTIGNAIAVRKNGFTKNLCLSKETYKEALSVFEKYRDSKLQKIPAGYSITWENVLLAEEVNGKKVPCVIKKGEYTGYFSSATSLKNGLTSNKGECECNNQVNSLKVPALVLVGGNDNIVRQYGAKLGDLIIAYNSQTKQLVYGIINDYGPKYNLGEGSVLLNMKLLGKNDFPKNIKDTYKLAIPSAVTVAIIPNSKGYEETRPYTAENTAARVEKWLKSAGFDTPQAYIAFVGKLPL